jgi:hypothetical protein
MGEWSGAGVRSSSWLGSAIGETGWPQKVMNDPSDVLFGCSRHRSSHLVHLKKLLFTDSTGVSDVLCIDRLMSSAPESYRSRIQHAFRVRLTSAIPSYMSRGVSDHMFDVLSGDGLHRSSHVIPLKELSVTCPACLPEVVYVDHPMSAQNQQPSQNRSLQPDHSISSTGVSLHRPF